MTAIQNRARGVAGRRTPHPRRDEPTQLLLAPRVEFFVHPAHVRSAAEAETLALTRWADLWRTWRSSDVGVSGVRPTFRDRATFEAAIDAHHGAEVSS